MDITGSRLNSNKKKNSMNKQQHMKKNFLWMVALATGLFGFTIISDVLSDVGTTIAEVKTQTIIQVAGKEFSVPFYTGDIKAACRKLPVGVREATMMSMGKIIKDYVESAEFKSDYLAYVDKNFRHESFNPNDEKWVEKRKSMTEDNLKNLNNPTFYDIMVQQLDAEI